MSDASSSTAVSESQSRPSSVLLEPVSHGTALGIVVATLFALRISPDAMLLVLLADHVILNEAAAYESTQSLAL
jgi:mannose-1-phosphate guanylyltransferase/mannose-6-phosphate isomerase